MKRVTCLFILVCAAAAAASVPETQPFASTVEQHASLDLALEAARKDNQLILTVFTADWCGPCHELKQQVLDTEAFRGRAGPLHMVYVNIDQQPRIAEAYNVRAIPDIVLQTGERKIVARHVGGMDASAMLTWIDLARRRAEQGAWQGAAAVGGLDDLKLPPDDSAEKWGELLDHLADRDPAVRSRIVMLLESRRRDAMPRLIERTGHPVLAMRVGAAELIRNYSPQAPPIDVWADSAARTTQKEQLQQWWEQNGKLRDSAPSKLDPAAARAVNSAITTLSGGTPREINEAMNDLTRIGEPALPALRDAITQAERTGNNAAMLLLEDVRWAILVPPALEQKANVRQSLARGRGEQRREAVSRLGESGKSALPALGELARDSDPLVQEQALHELGAIGGAETIAAMAELLTSPNGNLRMVAAQQLGATADAAAAPYLAKAFGDPDELVATVAIAAVEQVQGKSASLQLMEALKDSRWRVRAAAAETLGKLQVAAAVLPINGLLDDDDPFVVRTALTALESINSTAIDAQKLASLPVKHPELTDVAVPLLIERKAWSALKALSASGPAQRAAVLEGLAKAGGDERSHLRATSQPATALPAELAAILNDAMASGEAEVLRKIPQVLRKLGAGPATPYVDRLLKDDDAQVRQRAAGLVTYIVAQHYGIFVEEEKPDTEIGFPREKALADQARWHGLLAAAREKSDHSAIELALFLTASPGAQMPVIDGDAIVAMAGDEDMPMRSAFALLAHRLSDEKGAAWIERVCATPKAHLALLAVVSHASEAAADKLVAPRQVLHTLENLDPGQRTVLAELLLGRESGLNLFDGSPRSAALARGLGTAKDPLARAMGLYLLTEAHDAEAQALLMAALHDEDANLRRFALSRLPSASDGEADAFDSFAASLSDLDPQVASTAVTGLLDAALGKYTSREPAQGFSFGDISIYSRSQAQRNRMAASRSPQVRKQTPAWLETARTRLANEKEASPLADDLSLLLGQYGDFASLERRLEQWKSEPPSTSPPNVLIGALVLSRDAKFVPVAARLAQLKKDEGDLREVLQLLRGINGDEVRALRREINERIQARPAN